MKTEHQKHLGLFEELYRQARIAKHSRFLVMCDPEQVAKALEELAELRHEKSQGWAASALRRRYEINVKPPTESDKAERKSPVINLTVYPE